MKDILFSMLVLCAFIMISCGSDDPMDNCSTTGLTYTNSIASIINDNCATSPACHAQGSVVDDYSTYEGFTTSARFDLVIKAINHDDGAVAMPLGGSKIASCDIDQITAWINDGFPE